jgi:hypothetical protein
MTGACIIQCGFLIPNVINYNNQICVTRAGAGMLLGAGVRDHGCSEALTRVSKSP